MHQQLKHLLCIVFEFQVYSWAEVLQGLRQPLEHCQFHPLDVNFNEINTSKVFLNDDAVDTPHSGLHHRSDSVRRVVPQRDASKVVHHFYLLNCASLDARGSVLIAQRESERGCPPKIVQQQVGRQQLVILDVRLKREQFPCWACHVRKRDAERSKVGSNVNHGGSNWNDLFEKVNLGFAPFSIHLQRSTNVHIEHIVCKVPMPASLDSVKSVRTVCRSRSRIIWELCLETMFITELCGYNSVSHVLRAAGGGLNALTSVLHFEIECLLVL
mmetsp:Transcript_24277/g.56260  ORF Transcript_24277/g.56260 Transcript_24277/m.56260 type:complete len:271 (-) Transcript_24277:167-979(-)